MHTLKLLLALVAAFVCTAASAQSLALYRNGQRINGVQEMPEQKAAQPLAYHVKLAPGDTFQAALVYTDAAGVVSDLTGSQRLYFQPLGCLTATPGGVISVPAVGDPSVECQGEAMTEFPVMWVYVLDGAGNVLTANGYFFHVHERSRYRRGRSP